MNRTGIRLHGNRQPLYVASYLLNIGPETKSEKKKQFNNFHN